MSTLVVDSLPNQEPQLCKAWVNFNGTGTVAIRASYNVSSITDNGTGNYTVNFTTAMSDSNYAPLGSQSFNGSASARGEDVLVLNTSSFRVLTYGAQSSSILYDCANVYMTVFR